MDAALNAYTSLPAPRLPFSAPASSDAMRRAATGATIGAVDESKVPEAVRQKLHAKANEFEQVFIGQMLQPMFESVGVDDQFGGGHGEEMFRSLLTNEYAKQVNNRGGFGIADSVYRELLRAQEMSHGQG